MDKEDEALEAIFDKGFIEYLSQIDLSDISMEKHKDTINDMGDALIKNITKPNGSIDPAVCMYFYAKGLLAIAVSTNGFLDFKKFTNEYQKK